MAVNLCSLAYGTTVTCSSVSADGYEPENLLKPGRFGQWVGFLAEHFIKPPLNITFTFPFKVDICSIILDPSVGSHRSSGLEIFSASLPWENYPSKSAVGASETSKQKQFKDVVATNIGKGYCNNVSPRVIQFVNRRYRSRFRDWTAPASYPEEAIDVLTRDLRCSSPAMLRDVNQVMVRITRSQGGSVPALKKVEIWGQPSSSCDKSTIQKILETTKCLQDIISNREHPSTSSMVGIEKGAGTSKRKVTERTLDSRADSKDVHVDNEEETCPEEFLDPITCHVMAMPILLPSGHTIDQQTLEKHGKIEATWGRPPNDPFTGIPFSASSKPITNVKLKARLDRFLLMGGSAFKNVPRTAGDAKEIVSALSAKTSVLVRSQNGDGDHNKPAEILSTCQRVPELVEKERGKFADAASPQKRPEKRTLQMTSPSGSDKQTDEPLPKKSRVYGVRVSMRTMSMCNTGNLQKTIKEDPVSHEKTVSTSLDDALASTLASLPSFTRPKVVNESRDRPCESPPSVCVNCKAASEASGRIFYRLPCQHLICRACTPSPFSSLRGSMCNMCNHPFTPSDLSRVHIR